MPARPLQLAWRHLERPLHRVVSSGHVDVVHGTISWCPPLVRAHGVVTVHDLTTVRFPEMCDAPSLWFPTLVRHSLARALGFTHLGLRRRRGGRRVRRGQEGFARFITAPRSRHRTGRAAPAPQPHLPLPLSISQAGSHRRSLHACGRYRGPRKDLPGLVKAFDAGAARRRRRPRSRRAEGMGERPYRRSLQASRFAPEFS